MRCTSPVYFACTHTWGMVVPAGISAEHHTLLQSVQNATRASQQYLHSQQHGPLRGCCWPVCSKSACAQVVRRPQQHGGSQSSWFAWFCKTAVGVWVCLIFICLAYQPSFPKAHECNFETPLIAAQLSLSELQHLGLLGVKTGGGGFRKHEG